MKNHTRLSGATAKFSALLMAGSAIAALSFATPALAATPVLSTSCSATPPTGTISFTPTTASSWFTGSNWSGGSAPIITTPQTNITAGGTAQISGGPATAGPVLNLCDGTVDLQTDGSLTAGSIAVGPSGTLLLSGSTNVTTDPTGAIYLDGGTLRSTMTSGSLGANIVVGDTGTKSGTISVAAGDTLTYTGALGFGVNSANLVFGSSTDTGTIVYAPTTPVSYQPFTPAIDSFEIAGGTLQAGGLAADDSLGNLLAPLGMSTKVDAGATLDFNSHLGKVSGLTGAGNVKIGNAGSTLIVYSGQFSGIISGAGGLVKDTQCDGVTPQPSVCTGANTTLVLSGTNTYTGGTHIISGTLQLGSGGAGGSILGNIVDDDTLAIDRSDTFLYNGVISGLGKLQQIGTGNTVLGGVNTYVGATTVSSGILTITATGWIKNSAVTVNSGGTLAGTGEIDSVTVASGGRIAGGTAVGSAGTLTIDHNLALSSGSTYLVLVTPATTSPSAPAVLSKLVVSGTATITGALLDISPGAQISAGVKYTLLTATGGLTGMFAAGSGGAVGNYLTTLSYDAKDAFVQFALINLPHTLATLASATPNETATIGAIDHAMNHGTTLSQGFSNLATLTSAQLAGAADQLSGEIGSDLSNIVTAQTDPFLTVLMRQPGDLDTTLGGPHRPHNATLWGTFFGGGGSESADNSIGSHGLTNHEFGLATGLDWMLAPSFQVGGALAASQTNFTMDSNLGTGTDDAYQLGLYLTKRFGRGAYVSGAAAYSLADITTTRKITFSGNADTLSGKVSAHTAAGRIEAGYRFGFGHMGLTPYAAFQYDRFNAPAYTETASSGTGQFALDYASHSSPTTSYEVGTGIDYSSASSRRASLHLYGRVAWAHETTSDPNVVEDFHTLVNSTTNSPFTVQGNAPAANSALLSFGAELRGRNGLSLGFKLNGDLSSSSTAYFGTGDLKYSW